MRFSRRWWVFLALGCALPGVVLASMQADQAKVTFACTGPGGLRFEGTGRELQVENRAEYVAITVPVARITTGIGLRDQHMHGKYLESAKYPTAELLVPRSALKFPAEGGSIDSSAVGTMTIHGMNMPVTFHYRATRHGNVYDVQGNVKVDMRDYGIATPSYLGVTVKPPVDVAVTFQLVER